jgi:hypothetical protein
MSAPQTSGRTPASPLIDRIGELRSGMGIMGVRLRDDSRQLEHLSPQIPYPPS